jgi:hypothetical protein
MIPPAPSAIHDSMALPSPSSDAYVARDRGTRSEGIAEPGE